MDARIRKSTFLETDAAFLGRKLETRPDKWTQCGIIQ